MKMSSDCGTAERCLFKLLLKVNVEIFKIVGVQEEKCGGAGRRSLLVF